MNTIIYIVGCIRFKGLCPVPERECLPALVEPRVEIDEATAFVVPLIDHRTRATCLTGGKASSLAFLMSLKDITDDEVRKLRRNKFARKVSHITVVPIIFILFVKCL